MREHTLAITAAIVALVVVAAVVGIWNLIDTQEPVDPIQLAP